MFMQIMGIHGDPIAAKKRIAEATKLGERLGADAYGYKRAFGYTPDAGEKSWVVDNVRRAGFENPVMLDPTAGGGSIPFEALRLGVNVHANDLNPVAWLVLKATIEFPHLFGHKVRDRFLELGHEWVKRIRARLVDFYPDEPEKDCIPDGYLWARTIKCPYCAGKVPLSPNWRLNAKGKGVRLVPVTDGPDNRHIRFEMVNKLKEHSAGTVKGGDGLCPFTDCGRVIDGDEIKAQAQAGQMGQQLYAVVYNRLIEKGRVKSGLNKGTMKYKKERGFRAPRPEDDVEAKVQAELDRKMPEWLARNIVPTEEIDELSNYDRGHRLYGITTWAQMFSARQFLGHGVGVDVFHELFEESSKLEVDLAALAYLAVAIDKILDYNSTYLSWHSGREVLEHTFRMHNFSHSHPIAPDNRA